VDSCVFLIFTIRVDQTNGSTLVKLILFEKSRIPIPHEFFQTIRVHWASRWERCLLRAFPFLLFKSFSSFAVKKYFCHVELFAVQIGKKILAFRRKTIFSKFLTDEKQYRRIAGIKTTLKIHNAE
jgi:hypothetical protein